MSSVDEFVSCLHLSQLLTPDIADMIGRMLPLQEHDGAWLTPDGDDVTHLCDRSVHGGFSAKDWTLFGWILDDESFDALVSEVPEEFVLSDEDD